MAAAPQTARHHRAAASRGAKADGDHQPERDDEGVDVERAAPTVRARARSERRSSSSCSCIAKYVRKSLPLPQTGQRSRSPRQTTLRQ